MTEESRIALAFIIDRRLQGRRVNARAVVRATGVSLVVARQSIIWEMNNVPDRWWCFARSRHPEMAEKFHSI